MVVSEVVKLVLSTALLMQEEDSYGSVWIVVNRKVLGDPLDFLRIGIPAGLYVVQNNLAYIATSHLEAATYQLLYQLKILTTAIFSVWLLQKRLSLRQWMSLGVLCLGVGLVQISSLEGNSGSSGSGASDDEKRNAVVGLSAVLAACCSSGAAGVYFEMVLKNAKTSVWVRNIQLSLFGVAIGLLPVINDWPDIQATGKGFWVGYNTVVWSVVLLQAVGGLAVAMVVKYADNILKGFATSLSILFSCAVSYVLFDFRASFRFMVGGLLILGAAYAYGSAPTKVLPAGALPTTNSTSAMPRVVGSSENTNFGGPQPVLTSHTRGKEDAEVERAV